MGPGKPVALRTSSHSAHLSNCFSVPASLGSDDHRHVYNLLATSFARQVAFAIPSAGGSSGTDKASYNTKLVYQLDQPLLQPYFCTCQWRRVERQASLAKILVWY